MQPSGSWKAKEAQKESAAGRTRSTCITHSTHPSDAPGQAAPLLQEAQRPQKGGEHGPEGADDVQHGTPESQDPASRNGDREGSNDLRACTIFVAYITVWS